jgi:hypothetical protein
MYTKDSQHVSLTIDEARNFFEEYIAESEWPPKSKVSGLSPGNFTPEWDDALSFADATAAFLNIPLAGANLYGGYFSEDYATQSQAYYTCISQKLLIAKNANGEMTCAIISIIPSHDCATLSYDEAGKRFNHGAKNPDFSGIVMYSSVEGNYTLLVNRFHKGVLTAGATLSADNYDKSIADMKSLLAYTRIMRNLHQNPAVKSGEYSSWGTLDLDEAVVTAPATNYNFGNYWWGYVYDYSGGGSGDYIGYIDCGGSGGGGSGSAPAPEIINNIKSKYPCLGSLVDAVIQNASTSGTSRLDKVLNTFGLPKKSRGPNLIFETKSANFCWKKSSTDPNKRSDSVVAMYYDQYENYYYVAINEKYIGVTTKEQMYAVLLHEAVHAYAVFLYINGEDEGWSNFFGDITKETYENSDPGLTEHKIMADKYVEAFTDALMSEFPGISREFAKQLAWGGLGKVMDGQLTSEQIEEYKQVLYHEKNGTSNAQGTYCK